MVQVAQVCRCPGTCYVDQAGRELIKILLSLIKGMHHHEWLNLCVVVGQAVVLTFNPSTGGLSRGRWIAVSSTSS